MSRAMLVNPRPLTVDHMRLAWTSSVDSSAYVWFAVLS